MLIKHDICTSSRIYDSADLDNFISDNKEKTITLLNWSPSKSQIAEQIQFALSNDAKLIISEILPDELPDNLTVDEINFFSKSYRFFLPKVFNNSNSTKTEDTVILLHEDEKQKLIKENQFVSLILNIHKQLNINLVYLNKETFCVDTTIKQLLKFKRGIILSQNPHLIHSLLQILFVDSDIILKIPLLEIIYSRFLYSAFKFKKNKTSANNSVRDIFNDVFISDSKDVIIDKEQFQKNISVEHVENNIQEIHKYTIDHSFWRDSNKFILINSNSKIYYTRSQLKFIHSNVICNNAKNQRKNTKCFIIEALCELLKAERNDSWERELNKWFSHNLLEAEDIIEIVSDHLNKLNTNIKNFAFFLEQVFFYHHDSDEQDFNKTLFRNFLITFFTKNKFGPQDYFYFFPKILSFKDYLKDSEIISHIQNFLQNRDSSTLILRSLPFYSNNDEILEFLKIAISANGFNFMIDEVIRGYALRNRFSLYDAVFGGFISESIKDKIKQDSLISFIFKNSDNLVISILKCASGNEIEENQIIYKNNNELLILLLVLCKHKQFILCDTLLKKINIDFLSDTEKLMLCIVLNLIKNNDKLSDIKKTIQTSSFLKEHDTLKLNSNTLVFSYLYIFSYLNKDKSQLKYKRLAEELNPHHFSVVKLLDDVMH